MDRKCCPGKSFTSILKFLPGFLFLILGGWLVLRYWDALVLLVKGSAGLFLLFAGAIALAIAKD